MNVALLNPRGFALSGGRRLSVPRLSVRNLFVPSDGRVALFILTRVALPAAVGALLLRSALPAVLGLQAAAFVLVQHFRPPVSAGLDCILLHLYQLLFGVLVVLGAVVAGMEPQAAMGAAICGLLLALVPLVLGVVLGDGEAGGDGDGDGDSDKPEDGDDVAPLPRTGLATRLVFTRAPSDTYPADAVPAAAEEV